MTDPWLHREVNVDIASVQDFALRVQSEFTDNFTTSLAEGVQPMITVHPRFGGGVVNEGAFFRSLHDRQRTAAMHLVNDVTLGLQALAMAAAAVAAEYAFGDAESAATVDDVWESFIPTAPPGGAGGTDPAGPVVDPGPDPVVPPSVYTSPEDSGTDDPGAGRTIAEGTPGQYTIGRDDEDMHDGVDPTPQPRG